MDFVIDNLPYAVDALEPHIDKRTMEIHHGKHHNAYATNLNVALKDIPDAPKDIKNILSHISKYSPAVRNNGGGFFNHNFFWKILSPNNTRPSSTLGQSIDNTFGSMDSFKEAFAKAGATRFGSGWAWLIVDENKKLAVCSTPNQDNPLMDIAEVKGQPILGLDVWEHAYYLHYQNRRPGYIKAFWNIVNWEEVGALYEKALS